MGDDDRGRIAATKNAQKMARRNSHPRTILRQAPCSEGNLQGIRELARGPAWRDWRLHGSRARLPLLWTSDQRSALRFLSRSTIGFETR
jgi:hypothetical protein